MGVKSPGNGGLLGGECHAFFKGFCGSDSGAVGRNGLLWPITDEKEKQVEEKHCCLWKKKKKKEEEERRKKKEEEDCGPKGGEEVAIFC